LVVLLLGADGVRLEVVECVRCKTERCHQPVERINAILFDGGNERAFFA